MIRSLYAPRPHPYYIVTPDYRRTSAGIRVMHMLCDALNRAGQEAHVVSTVVNPQLMTPILKNEMIGQHLASGVQPITVYPEVISGNPMRGEVVARYLLNVPGHLSESEGYGEDDLVFAFSRGLLLPDIPEEQVMFLQPVDLSVFRPPENPAKRIPGKVCYYRGRQGGGIDESVLPPDAIEITATYPDSWEELVDIFQTCEYFYSSNTSALGAEAALCGCVGVMVPGPEARINFSAEETGSHGVAWGFSPAELERARRTIPLLRESLKQQEVEFWRALDRFIEITQAAASKHLAAKQAVQVPGRLAQRNAAARALLAATPAAQQRMATLGLVILDPHGDRHLLGRTLASLDSCAVSVTPLVVAPTAVDAVNQAVAASGCEWLLVVHAGEELIPSALLMVALKLAQMADHRAVFADEMVRGKGDKLIPWLRPDINLDLLLSFPAGFASHWLLRRDLWERQGGFSVEHPHAFELEYILRLIEAEGLTGLGHISEPLVLRPATAFDDVPQQRLAIEGYVQRRGFTDAQVSALSEGRYEVDYGHAYQPMVSILIVLDGQLGYAQRCLESLLEHTAYAHYEVLLLDRGNSDPAAVEWLAGIEALGAEQLQVLRFTQAQPHAALRNQAATQARGEFLLFLDCTVGVTGRDWLHQLLNHAMRPEVGCVSGKLVGGNGKVRHGPPVLGLDGPVGEPFSGKASNDPGYMWRLQVDQGCSAVSGHCLMVRREQFIAAEGFDQALAPWEATDLCLKFTQAGYLNIWTPRVQLLISDGAGEDASARPASEALATPLYERWLPVLARDPAYNQNLSLAAGFALDTHAWPLPGSLAEGTAPKVLAYPQGKKVDGQARLAQPFQALHRQGLIEGALATGWLSVVELERYAPDAIVLQRQVDDEHLAAMGRINAFSRAFKVYDLDRYLPDTPMPGFNRPDYGPAVLDRLRVALGLMDRLVVPSAALAEVFTGFTGDIRVLEPRLDPQLWEGLSTPRNEGTRPRVALAARGAKPADTELISEVVQALAGEVDWVLIGYCPPGLRPFVREIHAEADDGYPPRLAGLRLDLALVPLENTLLNRCKSPERLLEFGSCGVAVIASDLEPHRRGLPVTLVADGAGPWLNAVREHLADLAATRQLGAQLQACVRQGWMLDAQALHAWRAAWLPEAYNP